MNDLAAISCDEYEQSVLRDDNILRVIKYFEFCTESILDDRGVDILISCYDQLESREMDPVGCCVDIICNLVNTKGIDYKNSSNILLTVVRDYIGTYYMGRSKGHSRYLKRLNIKTKQRHCKSKAKEQPVNYVYGKRRIDELDDFYKKAERVMGKLSEENVSGIEESYLTLVSRGLPALEWMRDGLRSVERKVKTGSINTNMIGYFVSIIRGWITYGRGYTGAWEDKYIIDLVEKKFNKTLSYAQVYQLYSIMGHYGALVLYISVCDYDYHGVSLEEFFDYCLIDVAEGISSCEVLSR